MMGHLGTGVCGVSNPDSLINAPCFCQHHAQNGKKNDVTDESSDKAGNGVGPSAADVFISYASPGSTIALETFI